jgi:hypothetical protein
MRAELLRWARGTPWCRLELPWRSWARSLAARRARLNAAPPAPVMLLALASVSPLRARRELTLLRLEPRLELSLRTLSTFTTHVSVLQPQAGDGEPAEPPTLPVLGQLWQSTVCRIVDERRRVELPVRQLTEPAEPHRGVDRAGSAGPESPGGRRGLRDRRWLERAPVQILPAPPRPAGSHEDGTAAGEAGPALERAARGTPQPAVPAVDLDRLTEQVVRQIDRRIVAHRERVGRF